MPNKTNGEATIAGAAIQISVSLDRIATQLKYLGNGDAMTPMGAIEAHSVNVRDGLNGVASAIEVGLLAIASAIKNR